MSLRSKRVGCKSLSLCVGVLIVFLSAFPTCNFAKTHSGLPSDDKLAPPSAFDDSDEFFQKNYQQDALYRLVADTVANVSRDKSGPDRAEERFRTIHEVLNRELADYPLFIQWKRIFSTQDTDYFDFEIYGEPYRLSVRQEKMRMPSQEELDQAHALVVFQLPLPKVSTRLTREDVQRQRFANKILREAVAEGKFFAIKNLVDIDLRGFFSEGPEAIAERFLMAIAVDSDLERQLIKQNMLPILSDPKKRRQLYDAFRRVQKRLIALHVQSRGKGEITRFVILFGGLPTHLIGARTEAGQPVPILGHVSKRFHSIYFDQAQVETYPTEALSDILRVELIPGETLSVEQRMRIVRTHERYQRERLAPKKKELDSLEKVLLAALTKAKGSLTDREIKHLVEKMVHGTAIGRDAPILWHSLERKSDKDYILFSVFGRRYFFARTQPGGEVTTSFDALADLYGKLLVILSNSMGETIQELEGFGNSWDDIQSKITHLATQYYDRLFRRGRIDAMNLLRYVETMDEGNGYLDEVRALALQIEKSQSNIPRVFVERPLENREFTVVQTLFGPSQNGSPGEILEITAVRYKGKEVVGKFQTFVHAKQSVSLEAAEKLGIEPTVFKKAPAALVALQGFQAFLGSSPILTHGQSKEIGYLNQMLLDANKDPIVNPIADTQVLAQRLNIFKAEESEKYHHPEDLIRHYLGPEVEPPGRGARLLRLLCLAVEELALKAKDKVDQDGLSRDYKRFLDKLSPSEKVSLRAQFDVLSKENPGKFYKATRWEVVEALLDSGQIDMFIFDYDKTIAQSLGWQGSDDWYAEEHKYDKPFYKGGFYPLLDRVNAFLAGLKFFKLMDKEIPRIIAKAQTKNVKVFILTARKRGSGQDVLLHEALSDFAIRIPLENIVLAGEPQGGANKTKALARLLATLGIHPPYNLKIAMVDDNLDYLIDMVSDLELWKAMKCLIWYDTKDTEVEYRPARYYMRKVRHKLTKKKPLRNKDAGYLFNAFGIAYARETPESAVQMGEDVLKALEKFQGDTKNSDFVRRYIRDTVAEDPELKRALLLQAMSKKPLNQPILFNGFFDEIRGFWGDIGLDENNVRYIKEDPSLRQRFDLVPHIHLDTLNVDGLTLVAKGTAGSLAKAGKIGLDGAVQELTQLELAA